MGNAQACCLLLRGRPEVKPCKRDSAAPAACQVTRDAVTTVPTHAERQPPCGLGDMHLERLGQGVAEPINILAARTWCQGVRLHEGTQQPVEAFTTSALLATVSEDGAVHFDGPRALQT